MMAEWSMKIKRGKQILSQEMKEKKTTATPNKSSWTILLSTFGSREGVFFIQCMNYSESAHTPSKVFLVRFGY